MPVIHVHYWQALREVRGRGAADQGDLILRCACGALVNLTRLRRLQPVSVRPAPAGAVARTRP
jgi:hypothetical protein